MVHPGAEYFDLSPQEAQLELDIDVRARHLTETERRTYRTIATEPERIAKAERRGAVKALRKAAVLRDNRTSYDRLMTLADAIENGADL